MAGKRRVFLDSLFTVLSNTFHRLRNRLRQWIEQDRVEPRQQRRFLIAYRPRLVIYGLLAIATLLCITALPSVARVAAPRTGDTLVAQVTPNLSETQRLEQQARRAYETGQFSDAVAAFERAAILYQESGSLEQAAESRVNQGLALQGLGLYKRSIDVLQRALPASAQPALSFDNPQGKNQCAEDLSEDLFEDRSQASGSNPLRQQLEALSVSSANAVSTVTALRGLGDALQITSDLEQSCTLLRYSLELAKTWSLTDAIAPTYLSLGNFARSKAIADLRLNNLTLDQASTALQHQKSLSLIQQELLRHRIKAAQEFIDQTQIALNYYQQAEQQIHQPNDQPANQSGTIDRPTSSDAARLVQVQAKLNRLSLFVDRRKGAEVLDEIPEISSLLNSLPLSRAAIEARINLAQSLIHIAEQQSQFSASSNPSLADSADLTQQAAQLLAAARQQAIDLGDAHLESYALGTLAGLYQRTEQWSEAKALTEQALEKVNAVSVANFPQTVSDVDLAYRWYRQLGQILTAQKQEPEAIEKYKIAVELLRERLRLDVASSNLNYQFTFSVDAQEPVHRELMDLLLRDENPSQANLEEIRQLSTSLLKAELTSFLQEPCTITTPEEIDTVVRLDGKTAVFYPVILPDRLEVIVKFPTGDLLHRKHFIPREQFLEKVEQLNLALGEDYTFEEVTSLSQELYQWIVKPVEEELKAQNINTLVFTLDRQLQVIPMSVLYDGQGYLIDRYAVSEILGLRFNASVQPLQSDELKIIAAGLSTIPPSLPDNLKTTLLPLENVGDELDEIAALGSEGIQVTKLADTAFTLANFNTRLNEARYPVVHLATHGQFSVDPQRTFLLMDGRSNDDVLIKVNELGALFRTRGQIRLDPIELLVLNACETAAGDNLAVLGLAGTAVRAGARSAIASLWTVDDAPSPEFTRTLYSYLRQPGISKAEALRQAQLEMKKDRRYRHPRYWSSYILAGNWRPLVNSSDSGLTGSSTLN